MVRDLRPDEVAQVDHDTLERAITELRAARQRPAEIQDLADLHGDGGLPQYRKLKHDLGRLLFEPHIALMVVGTNAEYQKVVEPLLKEAGRKLKVEFDSVAAELVNPEPEVDVKLKELQGEVVRFETCKTGEQIRVKALAEVRDRVQAFAQDLSSSEQQECAPDNASLAEENALLREAISELTLDRQVLKRALQEAQIAVPPRCA